MSIFKKIKRDDLPVNPKATSVKDQLYEQFEQLTPQDAIIVKLADLHVTLGGVSHAIRSWNSEHETQVKMRVKNSRDPEKTVIYLFLETE